MRLKDRLKYKDKYCTKFIIAQINAVKKYFNIPNSKRVYALGWWCDRDYFLCDNKVYAVYFDHTDNNPYKPKINSAYIITLKNEDVCNFEIIKTDDTTSKFEEIRGIKIDRTRKVLTTEHIKLWLDSPCCVNEFVNV